MNSLKKTIMTPLLLAAIVVLAAPCGRKGPDAPLTIVSTSPERNQSEIPTDAVVSVTFSEPVDGNTLHFSLMAGTSRVTVNASSQEATTYFTPVDGLQANTVYTAIVSRGVRDLYGDSMNQDYLWYFTTGTGGTAPPTAHTVTASAGPGGSIAPSGAMSVNDGAVQQFAVTAAGGYHIVSVAGCSGSLSGTTYATGIIHGDCAVTATFEVDAPVTHTITAGPVTNGSISPSGPQTVNDGASLTFTITPSPGYDISSVLVDGASVGPVTSYTFENVTADHAISALFAVQAPAVYTITVGPVENGSITPGTTQVQSGGSLSFTIAAHFGYYISEVKVDDEKIEDLSRYEQEYTYAFENVTSDHKITARFRGLWHISATFGENGAISPAGQVPVEEGADQAFTINPDVPYVISQLIVDGGEIATAAFSTSYTYTFINVTADHSIHADFGSMPPVPQPDTDAGDIARNAPQPGANERTVTLTVIPDARYSVTSATGCGSMLAGSIRTTGFVAADCSVTALFSNIMLTITPLAEANGGHANTPQLVEYNATATFTIAPGGYAIGPVSGCGGTGNGNTCRTAPGTAGYSPTAGFASSLFTVTPFAETNGEIAPSAPRQATYQGSAVFLITPAPGYAIGSVDGCGGRLSGNVYATGPITGDCTVTATFNQSIVI